MIEGLGWALVGVTALGASWGLVRITHALIAARRVRRRISARWEHWGR
jgi:hypothetical protein